MKKRLLHIALRNENEPNHCMTHAFKNCGYEVFELDWQKVFSNQLPPPPPNYKAFASLRLKYENYANQGGDLSSQILKVANTFKPDIVFMQIQTAGVIDHKVAEALTKNAITINWTGDCREDIKWYSDLSPHITTTMFTNETDVEKMRAMGLRADYLQVGFDTHIFKPNKQQASFPEIVFLGNNYHSRFPLSKERAQMVKLLQNTFGNKFGVFGTDWGSRHLNPHEENICYANCKIAINQNHFDYRKFSSDRILRIMGSGAFCLTKYFEGIEEEYENKKNLVWFKTFDEMIELCNYYLAPENEAERMAIAQQGCKHVHENCTWEKRFGDELTNIINKYQYAGQHT